MKIARLFFIIFLFSLCNGENAAINSLCAVRFQYLGALVECTAGCFDIIDEQNRFAVNIETVNQIKCAEKIDASFLCRRAALCFGFADFIERFKARDTETVSNFLSQKFRLIIPSCAFFMWMYRHGNQTIYPKGFDPFSIPCTDTAAIKRSLSPLIIIFEIV